MRSVLTALLIATALGCALGATEAPASDRIAEAREYQVKLLALDPAEDRTVLIIDGVEDYGAENLRLVLKNSLDKLRKPEAFTAAEADGQMLFDWRSDESPVFHVEARAPGFDLADGRSGQDLWMPVHEIELVAMTGASPRRVDLRKHVHRTDLHLSTPSVGEEHRLTLEFLRAHSAQCVEWGVVPTSGEWRGTLLHASASFAHLQITVGSDSYEAKEIDLQKSGGPVQITLPVGEVRCVLPDSLPPGVAREQLRVTLTRRLGKGEYREFGQRTPLENGGLTFRYVEEGEYLLDLEALNSAPAGRSGVLARVPFVHDGHSSVDLQTPSIDYQTFTIPAPPMDEESEVAHVACFDATSQDVTLDRWELAIETGAPITLTLPPPAVRVHVWTQHYEWQGIRNAETGALEPLQDWTRLQPYLVGLRTKDGFHPRWLTVFAEDGTLLTNGAVVQTGLGGLVCKLLLAPNRSYRFVASDLNDTKEQIVIAADEPWIEVSLP